MKKKFAANMLTSWDKMPKKMTQEWLMPRLRLLNAAELEKDAGLTRGRIGDAKRGKAKLNEEELDSIRFVLVSHLWK